MHRAFRLSARRVVAALTTVATVGVALVATAAPAHAYNGDMGSIVFAYVLPGDAYLNHLISSVSVPNPPAMVVLDIAKEATQYIEDLDTAADALRTRGIKVYGYVDTALNTRSQYDVDVDINWWLDPYQTGRTDGGQHYDGIFFDQVPRQCVTGMVDNRLDLSSETEYVRDVFAFWSYTGAGEAIANVGTAVEDCMPGYAFYDDMPNYWVTFEGTYADYVSTVTPACGTCWNAYGGNVWNTMSGYYDGNFYFPGQFIHIIHSTSTSGNMNTAITDAEARGARYTFVTNDVMANPFDAEPSFLNAEITYAAGI
jgi:hypothetical protein